MLQILLVKNIDSAKERKKKAFITVTEWRVLQLEGLQKLDFIYFYGIQIHWATGTMRLWHSRIPSRKVLKTEEQKIHEFSSGPIHVLDKHAGQHKLRILI